MKTVSDVAAFLKRNPGKAIYIAYNERLKRFEVTYDRTTSDSKYLDDALENLSETFRRRDSGMTLKAKEEPVAPSWAQTTVSQHLVCLHCNDTGVKTVSTPLIIGSMQVYCHCPIGSSMFKKTCP